MSRPRDLLGRIANARAQMMMRGYSKLMLEIGEGHLAELGDDLRTVLDWPEVRAFVRRDDLEGWTLRET